MKKKEDSGLNYKPDRACIWFIQLFFKRKKNGIYSAQKFQFYNDLYNANQNYRFS